MYYTTLNKIRVHNLYCNGWNKLLQHLDKTGPDDEPLSLLTILESNGIEDAVWALRAVDDPACERDARIFAVRCVRQVQHLIRDERAFAALHVAERHAVGMATDAQLSAVHTAAGLTERISIHAAAEDVAGVNARETAWHVAIKAAWAAAEDAGDKAQRARLSDDAVITAHYDVLFESQVAQAADFRALFCAEESPGPA